jgi:hypothetical protein
MHLTLAIRPIYVKNTFFNNENKFVPNVFINVFIYALIQQPNGQLQWIQM